MRKFDYTKFSQRTWSNDILNLIAKIHECKGRQELYIRQKPQELERLVELAKIQSTTASNQIEGIVTTSTRMKQLFAEKTVPKNRSENEIMSYRDVLNTIHESFMHIPVKSSYLLQLHRDLYQRAGISYGGHFKNVQNYINETREDGTVITRFTPMKPYETKPAIENLCNAYEYAVAMEEVDALILIPIFICDFLCIHPFNDGNWRMSRLLTLLLLYKSGYYVGKYISIEKQIEKTKDIYYAALQNTDVHWHEEKNDDTAFIHYMLTVILACYKELEERVGVFTEKKENWSAYDIVKNYVNRKIGKFTGAEVIENCPSIGRSSVLEALKKLVNEGQIIRYGRGKGTYYVRAEQGVDF